MQFHGPGENTDDPDRLAFASRKPLATEDIAGNKWPMRLGHAELCAFADSHEEIENALYGYRNPAAPTPPAFVGGGPEILIPGNFGVYEKAWFNQ
jgi:hypothetical protein